MFIEHIRKSFGESMLNNLTVEGSTVVVKKKVARFEWKQYNFKLKPDVIHHITQLQIPMEGRNIL